MGIVFLLSFLIRAQASHRTHTISGEANLGEVSLILYGTTLRWKQIASWNHLIRPYLIHKGQILVLKKAPTLPSTQGQILAQKMWSDILEKKGTGIKDDRLHPISKIKNALKLNQDPTATKNAASSPTQTQNLQSDTDAQLVIQQKRKEFEQALKIQAENKTADTQEPEQQGHFTPSQKNTPADIFLTTLARAQELVDLEKPGDAITYFEKAIRLNPESTPAWIGLLATLKKLGQTDQFNLKKSEFLQKYPALSQLPLFREIASQQNMSPDKNDQPILTAVDHQTIPTPTSNLELLPAQQPSFTPHNSQDQTQAVLPVNSPSPSPALKSVAEWISQIKSLQDQGKLEQAKETALEFIKEQPNFSALPLIKNLLEKNP